MGNTQKEILSQLRASLSMLREQIDIIENKIAELESSEEISSEVEAPVETPSPVEVATVEVEQILEKVEDIPVEEPKDDLPFGEDIPEEPEKTPEVVESQIELETPIVEETVVDLPSEEAKVEEPVVEETIVEETVIEEPVVEVPKEEEAASEESAPAVETPVEEATAPAPEVEETPVEITMDDISPVDLDSLDVNVADTDLVNIDIAEDIPVEAAVESIDIEPVVEDILVDEPSPTPEEAPVKEEPTPVEAEPEPVVNTPLIKEEEPSILSPEEPAQASVNDVAEKPAKAVIDIFSEKLRWKTDMPGTPVKNIVSAISLNDRALFINTLFHEDPVLFMTTISALNSMTTLEEALTYIGENFSSWNMKSDGVYRFMMAVRRKLK